MVNVIVEVQHVNVNHVQEKETVFMADKVILDAPNVSARVVVPDEVIDHAVTVTQFVSRVPAVIVIVPEPLLNVSCKVQPHHAPEKEKADAKVVPAIVIVFPVLVALKVNAHVYVLMSPLYNAMLPDIVIATDPAHVILPEAGAQKVKSLQSFVVASMVTVYAVAFEALSKITSSVAVGRLPAHGAPPEVVAQ